MVDVHDRPEALTPEEAAEVRENVEKSDEVIRWLDALGPVGRRRDRGALGADLSDLYIGARRYGRMLDQLLAMGSEDVVAASEKLGDIAAELRHMAWHIRSVAPRLDRLAVALDPEDDEPTER